MVDLVSLQTFYASNITAPLERLDSCVSLKAFFVTRSRLGSLPFAASAPLTTVLCDTCELTGSVFDYTAFPTLVGLSVENNLMTGNLPATPSNMLILGLANNSFEGPFVMSSSLLFVSLSGNRLSGTLPSTLPSLMQSLTAAGNSFTGVIPQSYPSSLTQLDLSNNQVRRPLIPDFVSHIFLSLLDQSLPRC